MADETWGAKVPGELKTEIQELLQTDSLTGKAFLEKVVDLYKFQKTKEAAPELQTFLKDLELHTKGIYELCDGMVKHVQLVKQTALDENQKALERRERQIDKLDLESKALKDTYEELQNIYNETVTEKNEVIEQIKQLTEIVESQKSTIALLKEKNDNLSDLISGYQEHEKEYVKLTIRLQEAQKALEEEIGKVKGLESTIEETKRLGNSKDELHKSEIEKIKSMAEIEKEKAELKITKEYEAIIKGIRDESNDKINSLQEKISKDNERYQELLAELRSLQPVPRSKKNNTEHSSIK